MPIPSSKDRIVWRIHIASTPECVFDMLSTDDGRAKFWAESTLERNGTIEFKFINGITTTARILEQHRSTRYVIEYFGSRVVFQLEADNAGGTDLTVTNTGFEAAEYDEILPGWLNVLFPLKAACDFGVDLRTHDRTRTWDDGYVDQ